jgi:hypothetical protein
MTMSGESARTARKTASETRCVRLIDRTSFAQKAAKEAKDLCTCSASSRVGTRMRAEVALTGETWDLLVVYQRNRIGGIYSLSAQERLQYWQDVCSGLPRSGLCPGFANQSRLDGQRGLHTENVPTLQCQRYYCRLNSRWSEVFLLQDCLE